MTRSAADGEHARRFADCLKSLDFSASDSCALAVSGGGDSVALMHFMAAWSQAHASKPVVLTIDHGLRPGSQDEAAQVSDWANQLGLKSAILTWDGPKPDTGLEEQARNARYDLLGNWCARHRIGHLFLGHTRDDLVETFLLRLARGSGIDGLAAMAARAPLPVSGYPSVQLLRPLLDFSRAELRVFLNGRGAAWLDDPMNGDCRYGRVRIRNVVPVLAAAGIRPERIAGAARHLRRARRAFEASTQRFFEAHASLRQAEALMDGTALAGLDREIGLRALSAALLHVSGRIYRPRFDRLERLFDRITAGAFPKQTLAGCCVGLAPRARRIFGAGTILISPEPRRRSRPDP